MEPIANRLKQENNFLNIVRAKVNLYPYQNEHMKSTYHVDQDIEHKVLLLPINTNNGYTEFENGTRFKSIENTAIIFNGNSTVRLKWELRNGFSPSNVLRLYSLKALVVSVYRVANKRAIIQFVNRLSRNFSNG